MVSTTGTSISEYIEWLQDELESKEWGEVSIRFTVCRGQVTDVRKESVETEHTPLMAKRVLHVKPIAYTGLTEYRKAGNDDGR